MPRDLKDIQRRSPTGSQNPIRCRSCGQAKVELETRAYDAEVRHDGRLYSFTVPKLRIPVCQNCGEMIFTEDVDAQVSEGLRSHLKLLTPYEIRQGIDRLHMPQKEVAQLLGIAEETISRWIRESHIQSRAMDNYLRVFFGVSQVRDALATGIASYIAGVRSKKPSASLVNRAAVNTNWNGKRDECRDAQDLVRKTGSTWGLRKTG